MTTTPRFTTAKEHEEKDWNNLRARVLMKDRIEGRKTITILKKTDDALSDLSSRIKDVERPTYDFLILTCVQAYKELHKLKENMNLNEITDDLPEDDE